MMIECPRCGFAQPKDQYCASCGVNMDQFKAKPKAFGVRLVQNPNFHLSLIGMLILVVVAWIFYTQSNLVSREVRQLLDLPVSSSNAGDPNEIAKTEMVKENEKIIEPVPTSAAPDINPSEPNLSGAATVATSAPSTEPLKLELTFLEIPREALAGLLTSAQRAGEGNGGRAYTWAQGAKINETLLSNAQVVGSSRSIQLANGAQLTIETPPTAPEMFQFALMVQITKFENKEAALRWEANFVMPQPEPPGQENVPAMRAVMESGMAGSSSLNAQGLVILVLEPLNRMPREEYIGKAGDGPWAVFSSPEFRSGLTDLVMVLQLK